MGRQGQRGRTRTLVRVGRRVTDEESALSSVSCSIRSLDNLTNPLVLQRAYVELRVTPFLRLLPRRQQRRIDRRARVDETPLHEPVRGSRGEQEQLLDPGGPGSALEVLQELIAAALVTVPGPHRERRNLRDRPRLLALGTLGTLSLAWAALVPTQRRARDDLPVPLHHRESSHRSPL